MRALVCVVLVVAICCLANGATTRSTETADTTTTSMATNRTTNARRHVTTATTMAVKDDVIQRTPTASTVGFSLKVKSGSTEASTSNDTSSDASSLSTQRIPHKTRLRTRSPVTSPATSPDSARISTPHVNRRGTTSPSSTSSATTSTTTTRKSKASRNHHRRHSNMAVKVTEPSATNLTSSATSNQAATAVSPDVAKRSDEPSGGGTSGKAGDHQPVDSGSDDDGYIIEDPRYYTYSKSSQYSSSLGHDPEFSSSEQYHLYQGEDATNEGAGPTKRDDQHAVGTTDQSSSVTTKSNNCHMMRKPMPSYANYEGDQTTTGEQKHVKGDKNMMMCYVCGDKSNPYADGGYSEECNHNPTKLREIVAGSEHIASLAHPNDDGYSPSATSTKEQLYAGKGQSPYLSAAPSSPSRGGRRHRQNHQDNYDDGSYKDNQEVAATGHGGGGGGSHGGGGHDGGGHGGDSNDGAGTETCKVQYRGKMKCKVCGDPKSDAVFSEQCDYEKDQPRQHHQSSYDIDSTNEKSYKSRPEKEGGSYNHASGSRTGGHGNGGGGGHGNGGGGKGGGGHDDSSNYGGGQDDGYGGGDGGYDGNYPNYDQYGGSNYNSDPYYGSGSDLYNYAGYEPDYYGFDGNGNQGDHSSGSGGGGGGHGGGRGSHGSSSGSKDSKDNTQPQASTRHESGGGKKDSSGGGQGKKDCKVVYKDFADVSPYAPRSNSNRGKSKDEPKMKCMVCTNNGGFGGVTEECSYSGGGSLAQASAFPSASQSTYRFDNRPLESLYPIDFDQYNDAFF